MSDLVRPLVDHDIEPGPLDHCQITGSKNLNLVVDLGHQPPCDSLLDEDGLDQPERTYPLRLYHCPDSGLAQLDYLVDGRELYYPNYPYKAGISWPLRVYQEAFADGIVGTYGIEPGSLCVDIGCNDGTLLTGFAKHGCRVVGVEPTNVAEYARSEHGLEVVQEFFTEQVGVGIAESHGQATVVTMTNAFAHIGPLGEVMRGILALLAPNGMFVTESHYLLDVLEKTQFDTIYHEHIRTYSLKSLMVLFAQYGLEVFDVQRGERYGGNIRAYVAHEGVYPVTAAVHDLLELEEASGLHEPATWDGFRERVFESRDRFMDFMIGAHKRGETVVGNSCPGRCSTLLNFYGVTPDLMPYIGELPTSLKLGKYLPGKHIPVVENSRIREDQPDYLVLLAWHYTEPIVERLRREGVKSKLIVPLPEFTILDD